MAQRRLSAMENPPSASSSEDESEEINDKEVDPEQNPNVESQEDEDEEEESDDEEEEEESDEEKQKKKPSEPDSSSDSEESDPEAHSAGTQPSPSASDFTIKPIASKPMLDSTKPKKPPSKPATPPSKLSKRLAEIDPNNGKDSQKKKMKVSNGDEKDGAVEEKKFTINRLWNEDDEIAVLKGMIEFQSKKGSEPHADMGAFHEFIKKSLRADVSKNQLVDKVRRLKKKYQINAEKGEDPVFSKPHELKTFELSKKIWGGGGASNAVDDNAPKNEAKKSRKRIKVNNSAPSPKEVRKELVLREASKVEAKDPVPDQKEFWATFPCLKESLELKEYSTFSMPELGKNLLKDGMSTIGSAKAMELEEKWKIFRQEEVALYLKRTELIQEQTKLILDAMKSAKP
ncbi:hypothetical protein ACSBR2_027634 [Camellia fascicularis]